MTPIPSPRLNALSIATLSADFTVGQVRLHARAGLIHSGTGLTFGWTEAGQWSTETLRALEALKAAMEKDMVAFQSELVPGPASPAPPPAHTQSFPTGASAPTGLGEVLERKADDGDAKPL